MRVEEKEKRRARLRLAGEESARLLRLPVALRSLGDSKREFALFIFILSLRWLLFSFSTRSPSSPSLPRVSSEKRE